MKNLNKVKVFIDQEDIEISCTNDNIINITGMIGSGKTTLGDKYRNNDKYIVITMDCFYRGQDKEHLNEETVKIDKMLKEKLPNKGKEEYFKEYYYEIIEYIRNFDRSVTFVLEGQHIYRFLSIDDIKGKLIVKRTCLIKCWKRSITRHLKKNKMKLKNHEITKKQYYQKAWYWIKRRTLQLKYCKDLNNFLSEIENK